MAPLSTRPSGPGHHSQPVRVTPASRSAVAPASRGRRPPASPTEGATGCAASARPPATRGIELAGEGKTAYPLRAEDRRLSWAPGPRDRRSRAGAIRDGHPAQVTELAERPGACTGTDDEAPARLRLGRFAFLGALLHTADTCGNDQEITCCKDTERRAMARSDKVAAVEELTGRFRDSGSVVLTEYRGLSVTQLSVLREALGENATFSVVKNTLTKIAVTEAGLEAELASLLTGPSAIAFVGGDVVEAAKGLRDFSRDNPALVIKGGVLDGKAITPDELTRIADLEPRDVLLAKLAGAMTASMSRAAAVFNALPTQVAQLAEALRVQRAEQGGDAAPAEGTAPAEDASDESSDES